MSSEVEKSLVWQDDSFYWNSRIKHIFDNDKWTDCIFYINFENKQREILAHKLILAMGSPVFERQFYGSIPFHDDPIIINDIDVHAFYAMIKFIYTEKIDLNSVDDACHVWVVADRYMIFHLIELCLKYIWDNLSYESAVAVYKCAQHFEKKELMDKCFECICGELTKLVQHQSFKEIEPDLLIKIFQNDQLVISSELVLFNALQRYSKKNLVFSEKNLSKENLELLTVIENKTRNLTVNENKIKQTQIDHTKHGVVIKKALKEIRFLTMSAEEFSQGPLGSNLLTDSEKLALLSNILQFDSYEIPKNFNNSKTKRSVDLGTEVNLQRKLYTHWLANPNKDCKDEVSKRDLYIIFNVNKAIWIVGIEVHPFRENLKYIRLLNENKMSLAFGWQDNKQDDEITNVITFDNAVFIQPFENYTIQSRIESCNFRKVLNSTDSFGHEIHGPDIQFTVSGISGNFLANIMFYYPYSKTYSSKFDGINFI